MTITYQKYFATASYENDKGFKQVVLGHCKTGMMAAGNLGMIGVLIYVVARMFFYGGEIHWSYEGINPRMDMVLWDKLLIFLLSLLCLWLARLETGPERGRLLMAVLVLVFCISSLLDDVIVGVSYTPSFLVLFMSIAVGTMPYRPWQTFALGASIMATLALSVRFLPSIVGMPAMQVDDAVYIFMGIMTVIFTGISALLYTSRYEQYRTRRKAEELKRQLEGAHQSLKESFDQLRQTQDQLIHAQKMASLGRVTAGIAHEIKNPLNFVNNFADLIEEQTTELGEELEDVLREAPASQAEHVLDLLDNLKQNASRIRNHGQRADRIVRRMLEHTQIKPGAREMIDVNKWIDQYIDLSYHTMKNEVPDLNIEIERSFDKTVGMSEIAPREMGQALMNLLNNALEAVQAQALMTNSDYTPRVTVCTKSVGSRVEIRVQDNGSGIPEELQSKVFEPFFTTNSRGTGLGLSLAYDIITQRHGGSLSMESAEQQGTTFIISLPRKQDAAMPIEIAA